MDGAPVHDLDRALVGLRDGTRRRILASFYARPDNERTVDEVAGEAAIHRTVAFQHLELLTSAGLLTAGARRGLRGKPARTYRLAAGPLEPTLPSRRFGDLASLLGRALLAVAGGVEAALPLARAYGRRLAAGAGHGRGAALDALGHEFGADYSVEGDLVHASPCVFREPCQTARPAVCAIHAAILEGALETCGSQRTADPLGPDASGCAYRLRESG